MSYVFFYGTIVVLWVCFLVICYYKRPRFHHAIIGLATVAYALTYETLFGGWAKLYYYLDSSNSLLYIVVSAILIYPALNVIYILFLPNRSVWLYSLCWILGMLLFEYITVEVKIINFTGWNPIPWSPLTYIVTYSWVYLFYRYLLKRMKISA